MSKQSGRLNNALPLLPSPLPPAICLFGPTASGKTALALALAAQFPVEIISVDSAQIYRDMNIGTAKPDASTLSICPHHLINIVDPTDTYSAARFRLDALEKMHEINARGHIPLLTGGTMLYFKALREGLSEAPAADPAIRQGIEAKARHHGWPALHAELATLDAETAARLAPNDAQRIQRALEIITLIGQPLARVFAKKNAPPLPFRLIQIGLMPAERKILHARIAQRFDAMLAEGLIDELMGLRQKYSLYPELPSMRCVGYRQAWSYLEGQISYAMLRETGIIATRQLAKRQMTWIRATKNVNIIDCTVYLAHKLIEKVVDIVEKALQAPSPDFHEI